MFHDLSSRSSLFRTKLMDEFQLLDNINNSFNTQAPVYTSNDLSGFILINIIKYIVKSFIFVI